MGLWEQLEAHLQRVLRWLNSCTLLTAADLCTLAWPDGATRQNQDAALERWCDAALLRRQGDSISYQLGPVGVRKLREANIPVYATTTDLHLRVQQGILLASRFAVGLWVDLMEEAAIAGFDWLSQPFRGERARADAEGAILYRRKWNRPDSSQYSSPELAVRCARPIEPSRRKRRRRERQ